MRTMAAAILAGSVALAAALVRAATLPASSYPEPVEPSWRLAGAYHNLMVPAGSGTFMAIPWPGTRPVKTALAIFLLGVLGLAIVAAMRVGMELAHLLPEFVR